ncbi:MAG: RNA polymerase factor sigma-54 [Thermoguttaceae bacterium]
MRLSFQQEHRQEQRQVFHQRMIQSMEILQMPLAQLEERIETELEQNPLLELTEIEPEPPEEGVEPDSLDDEPFDTNTDDADDSPAEAVVSDDDALFEPPFPDEHEPELVVSDSILAHDTFNIAEDFAASYGDTIDELPARSQNWIEEQDAYEADRWANVPSRSETLQDHLVEQLAWFDLEPPLRAMVERIIYNLDKRGFFPTPIQDFLGLKTSDEEKALAEEALRVVQRLEPTGVGARSLEECLLMQVRDDEPLSGIVRVLITQHLSDVARNRIPHIVRVTGFSQETIQDAIAVLKRLNPRPVAEFLPSANRAIRPDIFVERQDDGRYTVSLYEGRGASLGICSYYHELRRDNSTDTTTRQYLRQKEAAAQWLIDAIGQRKSTLLRVSQAIVDYQTDFLERGPEAIKPLKMQQIADQVGFHVTTVSRTCDGKWIQTPHGIFPMRRFFAGSVASSEGEEDVAQDIAFIRLREVIDGEDKKKPHSDEELVKLLASQGVKIARRTVVKYRQAMNIPSSRERREW